MKKPSDNIWHLVDLFQQRYLYQRGDWKSWGGWHTVCTLRITGIWCLGYWKQRVWAHVSELRDPAYSSQPSLFGATNGCAMLTFT